jgi:hypothetical protein
MRTTILALVAGAFALAVPATAHAETTLSASQVLRIQKCDASDHVTGWTRSNGDSPLDSNHKAFVFDVGTTGESNGNCVVLYSRASTHLSRRVGAMHNLSFEFLESGHVGAGAPRISVILSNGLVAYLAGFYCNQPLAASNNTWGRADFTGSTTTSSAACRIWDSNGNFYDSTATQSAWSVFAAAHSDLYVNQVIFVGDESGHYAIDRLSLGAGWMYDQSRFTGKFCDQKESAC